MDREESYAVRTCMYVSDFEGNAAGSIPSDGKTKTERAPLSTMRAQILGKQDEKRISQGNIGPYIVCSQRKDVHRKLSISLARRFHESLDIESFSSELVCCAFSCSANRTLNTSNVNFHVPCLEVCEKKHSLVTRYQHPQRALLLNRSHVLPVRDARECLRSRVSIILR